MARESRRDGADREETIPARDLGDSGRLTNQRLRDRMTDDGRCDGLPMGPSEDEMRKEIDEESADAPELERAPANLRHNRRGQMVRRG